MSIEHRGFVGLFDEPLDKEKIQEIIQSWLDRFGSVEQTAGNSYQILTLRIQTLDEIRWEEHLQFRVLCGEQFAWAYLTQDRFVIETSGLHYNGSSILCRDILDDLKGCREIIDEKNDSRLDELEAQGLM
jgi:hypothetical protein